MDDSPDFSIPNLGPCTITSPVSFSSMQGDFIANYVDDEQRIVLNVERSGKEARPKEQLLERAGPRPEVFFEPGEVCAGIITCGGLCPGLNNVIRAIVMSLWFRYGVRKITGIRYGFRGLLPEFLLPPIDLTPELVDEIHLAGGTMLGSSRGEGNRTGEIVDAIERMGLTMLFLIGGDGTQRASLAIASEAKKRGLRLAVIGVPKTIDNDFAYIQRSFGFETAVAEAVSVVACAHTEAKGVLNGISVVKVMGRESGFIAAATALAANSVNYALIPEVPFTLEGETGFLRHLAERIERKNHAVIVIAEGAGQELLRPTDERDASGNKRLGDIGILLTDAIRTHFTAKNMNVSLRYFDPSYIIRSVPAAAPDALYCMRLGNCAAHAAMAGKTGMLVGLVNDRFVHLPIGLVVETRNRVDPESSLWRDVLDATGQPPLML